MKITTLVALLPLLLSSPALAQGTLRWPVNEVSGIGNNYGAFQQYAGGAAYLHDGLDILTTAGQKVFAVTAGTVTHVTRDPGGIYAGVMIGDPVPGGEGYLYWHLDSIAVEQGDEVIAGTPIGTVTYWPITTFHHLHFSRVRGTGAYPWAYYEPLENPVHLLRPRTDTWPPIVDTTFHFLDPIGGSFLSASGLHGAIDVVVAVTDVEDAVAWGLAPNRVELTLRQGSFKEVISEQSLNGPLGSAWLQPDIVFALLPPPTISAGDYNQRRFYIVVTNRDGAAGFTSADRDAAWDTTRHPNGDYTLELLAVDWVGNAQRQSVAIHIDN